MIKDYRLLAVASAVALVAILLAVAKSSRTEYAGFQKEYYKLCAADDFEIGINQLNVKVGTKALIDRCTTCHLGFANPDAADFANPLKMHPPIAPGDGEDPHDLGEIGCVVCHDGNGRAVTKSDAHGEFHMWPAPRLTGAAVQANCIRCHDTNAEPLAGAGVLNRGRSLYMEKACWSCHTIAGVSDGKVGPDLSNVGAQFSMDYLHESIVHPTANIKSSLMPEFDWVDDDEVVDALTVYLKSQRKTRLREYAQAPVGVEQPTIAYAAIGTPAAAEGRKIFMGEQTGERFRRGGCINCHAVREADGKLQGGSIGPELTYAGRARDDKYLNDHIRNSKSHTSDSVMPAFTELKDKEVDSLVQYLNALDYADTAVNGARVYTTYCASCHGDDLKGRGKNYKLLDPYPRNLSRHQFVKSYRKRFTQSIGDGIEGTAMAPWKDVLNKEQIKSVIDFIDAASSRTTAGKAEFVRLSPPLPKVGDTDRLTEEPIKAIDTERGELAFMRHCTGCHGKLANGKGPNAYEMGNVYPRNLINKDYMKRKDLDDERLYHSILLGVPGTPMPSHNHLADQTVLDLMAYIKTLTD